MNRKKRSDTRHPQQPERPPTGSRSETLALMAARWIIRYYVPILIAACAISIAAFQQAVGLKLDTKLSSLMPEGVASVENLNRVMDKTGSFSNAMVVVDSPDPNASLRFVKALRQKVLALPWVSSAEYAEDTSVFERHKLLYMDTADLKEIQRRIDARINYEEHHPRLVYDDTQVHITIREGSKYKTPPPLEFDDIEDKYRKGDKKIQKSEKLFQSEDGQVTILVVWPRGETTDVGFSRRLTQDLYATAQALNPSAYHPRMSVHVGGRIMNRVVEFDAAINDVRGSALWSITAILVLLIMYYRRLFSVVYIGIPLLMGILWTFGLTKLVLGSLNVATIFLVLVLFGLGIDFGIHNLARYDEVRRCGGSLEGALATILRRTGRASLMAAMTTIAGFYALLITDFRAFYEFGFIAGTGVAVTFAVMYIVFPALMLLAEKIRLYRASMPQIDVCTVTREGFPWPRTVLLSMLGLFALGLVFAKDVNFEDDYNKLRTVIPEYQAVKDRINKVFTSRSDRAVVFVPTLEEVKALVDVLEELKAKDTESPTIDRVASFYSIVPPEAVQSERLKIIRDIATKVESLDEQKRRELADITGYLNIGKLTPEALPPALRRIYTGLPGSGGYLVYIYNIASMALAENARAFTDDIRKITVNGKTYYPATEALIFVDMRDLMKKDALVAVVAVTSITILLLILNLRSLRKALIVLFPIAVGIGLMVGIMGLFDIRLSIFNMVVMPTVIGIGVDNGIHIFHRYEEEGARSLRHVIRTTGWAAAITTLTTMLGFAGMLTASNQGLQSLGLLASVGLGTCLLSSLTVLPALLQWLESRKSGPGSPITAPKLETVEEPALAARVA